MVQSSALPTVNYGIRFYTSRHLIVPTIENREELCSRVCFSFLFFFLHEKSGTTNNHRNGWSDISY